MLPALRICTVSLTAGYWRPSDPRVQWPAERWPLCLPVSMCERQHSERTHAHMYACNTIIRTTPLLFSSPNGDAHTHTSVPPLAKNVPALVVSAWGCVFFFVCRNSCLHSPISPNRGKENKNIMKGLKEITGCQNPEAQSVHVWWACLFTEEWSACVDVRVLYVSSVIAQWLCVCVHVMHVWVMRIWQNLLSPACLHLLTEEWHKKPEQHKAK